MATYRASLGTRGELRRIAAEAETATIERVRPWHRKTQPCRLAPHVIVPQWIRSELPPKPRNPAPPTPVVFLAQAVAAELVAALLDSACANASPPRPDGMEVEPAAALPAARPAGEAHVQAVELGGQYSAVGEGAGAAVAKPAEASGGGGGTPSAAQTATLLSAQAALGDTGGASGLEAGSEVEGLPLTEAMPTEIMEVDTAVAVPADAAGVQGAPAGVEHGNEVVGSAAGASDPVDVQGGEAVKAQELFGDGAGADLQQGDGGEAEQARQLPPAQGE